MKKGRSQYTFSINCDQNLVNNLIQSYIVSNNYALIKKNGEQYYRAGEPMLEGYRYFNYFLNERTLIIYAWFKGALGDVELEGNNLNPVANTYRESLSVLFQEINKLNSGNTNNYGVNFDPQTGQPINIDNQQSYNQNSVYIQQNTQFVQNFQNQTVKKQENMCEWGFWMSVFGLIFSFFGIAYGIFIYILNFYFASQGLKTRKRGKAIATIIMSILSILFIILQIIMLNH